MRLEQIDKHCIFAFLPELEPVFGVMSILQGEYSHDLCTKIYGTEQIAAWKSQFRFLFEAHRAVIKCNPSGMLDFLLDLPLGEITLEGYRDAVLEIPVEEYLWRQLDLQHAPQASLETVQCALTEDASLDLLYGLFCNECDSILAFTAFVRQSRRYVEDYFAFAACLQTQSLTLALEERLPLVEQMYRQIAEGLRGSDPLEYSQQCMGKTFRNRGPYDEFIYLPTLLMPYRAGRYFHTQGEYKRQMLFLTMRNVGRSRDDTLRTLKAAADGTRYQILTLLAQEGPLRGMDIARHMSIAASTVSHHMEQLKEGGLITEEQVKNSKYYGLDRNNTAAFLKELERDLCK